MITANRFYFIYNTPFWRIDQPKRISTSIPEKVSKTFGAVDDFENEMLSCFSGTLGTTVDSEYKMFSLLETITIKSFEVRFHIPEISLLLITFQGDFFVWGKSLNWLSCPKQNGTFLRSILNANFHPWMEDVWTLSNSPTDTRSI